MKYEAWAKEEGTWYNTETYFDNETEAYNYLVRVANTIKKVEAIKIQTEDGETTIEEEL